jgi:nitric oxide reductase NorD protein
VTPPGEGESTGPGRFRLLASAIAGRSIEVSPVEPGELPWTDGVTVYVDERSSAGRQLAALAVQSSLLGAGSLESPILAALARRPTLARRYLAVEGHRALSLQEPLLPISARRLIDRTVAGRTGSAGESLALARSGADLRDPPEAFGTIRPKRVEAPDDRPNESGALHRHVPARTDEAVLRELDGGDDGPTADIFSSPVGGGGGIGRLLKRLFGEARSPGGGPPGADSPTRWSRRQGSRVGSAAVLSTAAAPVPEGTGAVERQGTTYHEWDYRKRRYKLDWCTVVEVDPSLTEPAPFVLPDTHGLRRPLARLGIELERYHRQLQGDDIDIDAAVEAGVELEAGSAPGEAVYIDTLRRRRDLSVLLLLDISGSAGEPSTTGAPVHEHQRAAAGALATALHQMGDRVALYGFRSQGRSAVHVLRVKRFADELDALVFQRLGTLVPGAYTRLGAAIRHGAAVLERDAGTATRLLVVLSDGFAYDHGYERAYGEADARRALAEARRRGVGSLCLSVGARTDAGALRRVFGTAAHAAIPRSEQLPVVIGPLFRSALRSAEQQRRVAQRRERARGRLDVDRRTA